MRTRLVAAAVLCLLGITAFADDSSPIGTTKPHKTFGSFFGSWKEKRAKAKLEKVESTASKPAFLPRSRAAFSKAVSGLGFRKDGEGPLARMTKEKPVGHWKSSIPIEHLW